MDNSVPVTTKKAAKFEIRLLSGTYTLPFLAKLKLTVEILRINEDYVTKTMFTLTEWLASPGATKFQNRYQKCQRKNYMFY